jgi:DNA ligase-1
MTFFRPMLADNKPFNRAQVERHLLETGGLIMQPKIDGMRALIDDEARLRTRSGKEHKNRYAKLWASQHPSLRGLDGELSSGHSYDGESFRESMSGIRSEEGSPEFTFFAFDFFLGDTALQDYSTRRQRIEEIIAVLGEEQQCDGYHAKLVLCPQTVVTTMDELYEEEEKLLVAGWEGAMLRRPEKPYKFNRSTWNGGELMKVKRFEDDEAIIEGYYAWEVNENEATTDTRGSTVRTSHKDGKRTIDRLGGFHCSLLRDRSVKFDIGVFRGWTHGDRDRLWIIRDTLPGKILKFKHQGYGGGYDRPRTPVGLGFRDPDDFTF